MDAENVTFRYVPVADKFPDESHRFAVNAVIDGGEYADETEQRTQQDREHNGTEAPAAMPFLRLLRPLRPALWCTIVLHKR